MLDTRASAHTLSNQAELLNIASQELSSAAESALIS